MEQTAGLVSHANERRRTTINQPIQSKRAGHVHRGTEYSQQMLAVASELIQPPVSNIRIIVGLTTTPKRIPHIRPVLEALLNQTQVPEVVLNVPEKYGDRRTHWNGKSAVLPSWLHSLSPRLHIHMVPFDWGPATKLVGTVGWLGDDFDNSTIIVATDDDQEWRPYALATLLQHYMGEHRRTSAWSYFAYSRAPLCIGQAGDLLAAKAIDWKKLAVWGLELLPGGRLPSCFFVDDMFFAAYLRHEARLEIRMHPWSRNMRRMLLRLNATTKACVRACSPTQLRLRYPDSLAMGPPRERHNQNCKSELDRLGWWPHALAEPTSCKGNAICC